MMFKPDIALTTLIIVFWIEALLSGIAWSVIAIKDKMFEGRGILAAISISQILVWTGLLFFPDFGETILKIFVVLLWISAIVEWVVFFIDSFKLKEAGFESWWWILIWGCLMILLWAFLVSNSLLSILILNSIIGLWLVIDGISMIIWALQIRKDI